MQASIHISKCYYSLFIVFFVFMVCCPAGAQHALKKLAGDDYARWGRLTPGQISDDGTWVSFTMSYASGKDTLNIMQTQSDRIINIPNGTGEVFAGNNYFICSTPEGIKIISLRKGAITDIGQSEGFTVTADNKKLMYLSDPEGGIASLCVTNLKDNKVYRIENVTEYSYNPASNKAVMALMKGSRSLIAILDIPSGVIKEIHTTEKILQRSLTWQKEGKAIAFAEYVKGNPTHVAVYDVSAQRIITIDNKAAGLMEGKISLIPKPMQFSNDGTSLVFYIEPNIEENLSNGSSPEIWHTFDKKLYPAKALNYEEGTQPKLAQWNLVTGKARMLTDAAFPYIMLTSDHNYALLWNTSGKEPDHIEVREPDYTVTNLRTNITKPFVANENTLVIQPGTSPDGKYATYFDGNNWFAYDFSTEEHYNLTAGLGGQFNTIKDGLQTSSPYGYAGWDRDRGFIVYDMNDIWKVFPGRGAVKITDAGERQIRYRLDPLPQENTNRSNFDGRIAHAIDFGKKHLLHLNYGRSGYAVLHNNKVTGFDFQGGDFSYGMLSKNGENFICLGQNYDTPFHLLFTSGGNPLKTIYSSNEHYMEYGKIKAEKIYYRTESGRELSGMLFYPMDYDPDRKYPVITSIYENQDFDCSHYTIPSFFNPAGFNIANYAGDGYFVYLPNISYGRGNPGDDAVDCVEAAVKVIRHRKDIDAARIGLIGHSFGGYQTNYILGHSDLFAVAVSGAPITELTSFYHYVIPGIFRPNFVHLEDGQLRIGKAYYEQPLRYLEASPIFSAPKITTPLLSWAGKDDPQIHNSQIIAFYLAMRRLNKEHITLLYPDEGHVLGAQDKQKDLTLKIAEWFGHHLKGEPLPKWAYPNYK